VLGSGDLSWMDNTVNYRHFGYCVNLVVAESWLVRVTEATKTVMSAVGCILPRKSANEAFCVTFVVCLRQVQPKTVVVYSAADSVAAAADFLTDAFL